MHRALPVLLTGRALFCAWRYRAAGIDRLRTRAGEMEGLGADARVFNIRETYLPR